MALAIGSMANAHKSGYQLTCHWPTIYWSLLAGWWFQPLWKIWVRQLGWLFHSQLNGKIKNTFQSPPTSWYLIVAIHFCGLKKWAIPTNRVSLKNGSASHHEILGTKRNSQWLTTIWWFFATYPSEKWWSEFVSRDDEDDDIPFPTEWKVIIHSCSSHQPDDFRRILSTFLGAKHDRRDQWKVASKMLRPVDLTPC